MEDIKGVIRKRARDNPDVLYIAFSAIVFLVLGNGLINALFSLPLLIIVPVRVGFSFSLLTERVGLNIRGLQDSVLKAFSLWSMGILVFLGVAAVTAHLGMFSHLVLSWFALIMVAVSLIPGGGLGIGRSFIKRRELPVIAFLVLNAVVLFLVFRIYSPFPLQLGADVFTENILFSRMVHDGFFSLYTPSFSSAHNLFVKLPVFPLLRAAVYRINPVEYLNLTWTGTLFNFLVLQFFLLFLCKKLGLNLWTSTTAAALGIWMIEWTKPSILYLMQSSTALIMLPAILYSGIAVYRERIPLARKVVVFGMLYFLFFSFHFFTASASIFFLFLPFLVFWKFRENRSALILSASLMVVFLVYIFLSYSGYVDLTNSVFWNPFNLSKVKISAANKFNMLFFWYTIELVALSIFGATWSFFKSENNLIRNFSFVYILVFFVFLMPIRPIHRIFPLIHLFVAVFSSFAIYRIIHVFNSDTKRTVIFMFIAVLIIMSLAGNTNRFLDRQITRNTVNSYVTVFTLEEIEGLKWIKQNTSEEAVFLSERETQNFIYGLGLRRTPGGPYVLERDQEMIKKILHSKDINGSLNAALAVNYSRYFSGKPIEHLYLFVTGRYAFWALRKSNSPVFQPKRARSLYYDKLEKFEDSSLFREVYRGGNQENPVIIYKISIPGDKIPVKT